MDFKVAGLHRWCERTVLMTAEISSVVCGGDGPLLPLSPPINGERRSAPVTIISNRENLMTPCEAYQKALDSTNSDVLVMLHDDLEIHDPEWLTRFLHLFENDKCVAVGLGGAVGLGTYDLFRKPFAVPQLARIGYTSNQDDAETHGGRFTGDRRVVVLEQFCMGVRVEWLRSIGGWPVEHLSHHLLDGFIACEADRGNWEVWQASCACHHAGGQSSTSPVYRNASWLLGGTMESDHILAHRWLYDSYPDVLPISV